MTVLDPIKVGMSLKISPTGKKVLGWWFSRKHQDNSYLDNNYIGKEKKTKTNVP